MVESGYLKSGLNYKEFVSELFSSLCRENILWAVLRNWMQLPETVRGDIDILIKSHDLKKIDVLIAHLSKTQGWIIISKIKKI